MKHASLADVEQRRPIRIKCLNMLWLGEGMVHGCYVTRLLRVSEGMFREVPYGLCKHLKLWL